MLKKSLGVAGLRLWFHVNGIDESNVHNPYKPKSKGLGNSQVLPRDYDKKKDIEIILIEMAEQVDIRLRREGKKRQLFQYISGTQNMKISVLLTLN